MHPALEEQLGDARSEIDALTAAVRLADSPRAVADAVCRRDAVLSARRDGCAIGAYDLAALEAARSLAGGPARPVHAPDRAAPALAYLEAMEVGRREAARGCSIPVLLDRMHAALVVPPASAQALVSPLAVALGDLMHPLAGGTTDPIVSAARIHERLSRIGMMVPAFAVLARLASAFILRPGSARDEDLLLAPQIREHPLRHSFGDEGHRTDARDGAGWVAAFAHDVATTAYRTRGFVAKLVELHATERSRIDELGKAAASCHRVYGALQRWPLASVDMVMSVSGLQVQTATSSLFRLRGLGIVRECSRQDRRRLYLHDGSLALLAADVESWWVVRH